MIATCVVCVAALVGMVPTRPILEPSSRDMRLRAGQLVPPPPDDWFDSQSIGACAARYDEAMGEWTMWYAGRPANFADDVIPIATGLVGGQKSAR